MDKHDMGIECENMFQVSIFIFETEVQNIL